MARRKRRADFLKEETGAAAIVMALLTPVLIGGLALGAEIGFWELQKRQLQNAADAGAHAAATQVRSGETDDTTLKGVAKAIAEIAGYEGGDTGITLQQPPTSGAYAGNNLAVHVTLDHSIPRRFTAIFDSSPVEFTVSSTALVSLGRPACVLATHPSADEAVFVSGSTAVTLDGCDVAANSISSEAVATNGASATLTTECVSTVGQVSDPHGAITTTDCDEPIENGPVTPDPYESVAEPSTCTSTHNFNQFPNQGSGATRCYTGNGGNVSLPGPGNSTTTLTSNVTYVFRNTHATNAANFTINGGRTLSGTNVTLYFEGKWTVTVSGGSQLNITAPTSGTYSGLALFGSRTSDVDMNLTGNNNGKIVGAIYSPNENSLVTFTGSSQTYAAGECVQVIAGKTTFTGNATFDTDCSNSGTREIVTARSIRIVE